MNLNHDFVQVSKLSKEKQKNKSSSKLENFFLLFPKHENISTACRFTSLRPYVPEPLCPCALMSEPLCPAPFCLRPYVVDRGIFVA